MSPDGISQGINCSRRLCSFAIGVYANSAEVAFESGLHEVAHCPVQRLSRRAEDFMNNRRSRVRVRMGRRIALEHFVLLLAVVTLAAACLLAGTLAMESASVKTLPRLVKHRIHRGVMPALHF